MLLIACGVSMCYLVFVRSYPRQLIWFTLIVSVIVCIGAFISACISGNITSIIVMAALLCFQLFYIWAVQNDIEFSAQTLEVSVTCIELYPHTMTAAIVSIIIQAIWLVAWIVCVGAIFHAINQGKKENEQEGGGIIFLLLISFFWTSQGNFHSHTVLCDKKSSFKCGFSLRHLVFCFCPLYCFAVL